jgi:hypothetical protein
MSQSKGMPWRVRDEHFGRPRLVLKGRCYESGHERNAHIRVQIRSEGRLVGYGLRATKPGVGDRIEGYLERTPQAKLSIAYPPSMRLGRLHRRGVTRKVAVAAFEAFAVGALKTVEVSRTETRNWSANSR